jgi:hypothetical protein
MRDKYLLRSPGRVRLKLIRRQCETKDRQFKTEAPPIDCVKIASDVPPLVPKPGMRAVIARELKAARLRCQFESGLVFGVQ